jgi:hypothetical protein
LKICRPLISSTTTHKRLIQWVNRVMRVCRSTSSRGRRNGLLDCAARISLIACLGSRRPLHRFPITSNHVIEKESLNINKLEPVF